MIPLVLTIDKNGTTYTYDDARLLSSSVVGERRARDRELEISTIDLEVGPNQGEDVAEIFGVRDVGSLDDTLFKGFVETPHYRAKVETQSGDLLLDGAVAHNELERRDETGSWRVRVLNQAARDFWNEVESWQLRDLEEQESPRSKDPTPKIKDVQCWLQGSEDRPFERSTVRAKEVGRQLKYYLGHLDIDYNFQRNPSKATDPLWMYVGRWNLDRLVEQVARVGGFRVIPSYQSFPSLDLEVDFVTADWPTSYRGGSDPGFDKLQNELAPGHTSEKEFSDNFNLTLENQTCEPSRNPINYGKLGSDLSGDIPTFASPLPYAIDAPLVWKAESPIYEDDVVGSQVRSDPRSMRTSDKEMRWRHPQIDIEGSFTDEITGNGATYGRPLFQRRKRSVNGTRFGSFDRGQPQDSFAYLFQIYDDGSNIWAMHHRLGIAGPPIRNEWMSGGQWKRHAQRYGAQQILEGEWTDIPGSVEVGDPTAGVSFENEDWVVRRLRRDLQRGSAQLVLIRPTTVESFPERPPEQFKTSGAPFPLGLQAEVQELDTNNSGKEDWLLIHWERGTTRNAQDLKYEIEIKDNNASTTLTTDTVFSTSYTYQLASSGNSGQSYDLDITVTLIDFNGNSQGSSFLNVTV